jgi:hypothetical protein
MKKIKLYEEFLAEKNLQNVEEGVGDVVKTGAKKAGNALLKAVGLDKVKNLMTQVKKNKEKAAKIAKKAQAAAKSKKPAEEIGLDKNLAAVQLKMTNLDAQKLQLKAKELDIKKQIAAEKAKPEEPKKEEPKKETK